MIRYPVGLSHPRDAIIARLLPQLRVTYPDATGVQLQEMAWRMADAEYKYSRRHKLRVAREGGAGASGAGA